MCLEQTIAGLETRRDEWDRLGVEINGAVLCDDIIRELKSLIDTQEKKLYTLSQAAAMCNLSVDHLGRLVREGKLPNAGRRGAPRIRGADLPQPRLRESVATSRGSSYDPAADARKLGSRQKGGP